MAAAQVSVWVGQKVSSFSKQTTHPHFYNGQPARHHSHMATLTPTHTTPMPRPPASSSCIHKTSLIASCTVTMGTARAKPVRRRIRFQEDKDNYHGNRIIPSVHCIPSHLKYLMTKPPSQPIGHGASRTMISPWQPQMDPLIIELMNISGQVLARGVAWTTTSSPVQRGAGGSEDSSLKRDGRGKREGRGSGSEGGGADG